MSDPNWRKRPKYWTEARLFELSGYLEQGWTDERIGREFGKSAEAINLARKKYGLRSRKKRFLSARDVSRALGINPQHCKTVLVWIRKGYLQARRGQRWGPRRQWYVRWEDLLAFLENPEYQHLWDREKVTDDRLKWWLKTLPAERYVTPAAVAETSWCEPETVHTWIKEGRIKAKKHNRLFIPESELVDFVPPNQRSRVGQVHHHWTHDEDAELVRLRISGRSYHEIATIMGRSWHSIVKRWHRLFSDARERRAA